MSLLRTCPSLIIIITCRRKKLLQIKVLKILQEYGLMVIIINGGPCGQMESLRILLPVIKEIGKNFKNGQIQFLLLYVILFIIGHTWNCNDTLMSMIF